MLLELRAALRHLIPDAAEGVVGEELDDIAGGEELVADGELPAVAGSGGFVAHGLPLGLIVVVLVNPADGFVLGPEAGDLGRSEGGILIGGACAVEFAEDGFEGRMAWEEEAAFVEAVEEDAEVAGEFVEEDKQIGAVGGGGRAKGGAGGLLEKLESLALQPLAHTLQHNAPLLGHAKGGEAVQHSEGLLAGQAQNSLPTGLGRFLACGNEPAGVVVENLAKHSGSLQILVGEMLQHLQRCGGAIGRNAVDFLELLEKLPVCRRIPPPREDIPATGHGALEEVAGGLVEGHG